MFKKELLENKKNVDFTVMIEIIYNDLELLKYIF